MLKDCRDEECKMFVSNWEFFADFNMDGKVSYGEAQKFFYFLWGLKCHMCSDEFLDMAPKYLAERTFAFADTNRDGKITADEAFMFCKGAKGATTEDVKKCL